MNIDQQYEDAILSGNNDLGIQLALKQAESQGFSVPAYHGTFQTFDEFKEHDIGFHFSKDIIIAQNRLDDKFDEFDYTNPERILHVALSIHNPIVVKADVGSWCAKDILDAAAYKYTKTPFMSQDSMYLYEQKAWAQAAHKVLKSIGIDKETALELRSGLNTSPKLNSEYTDHLRQKCIESKYDAIIYPNDFESEAGFDSTSYIVFQANQIKTLQPVWVSDGVLRKLSSRFDRNSPRLLD